MIGFTRETPKFVRFVNMLINDSIFSMDEALTKLASIRTVQVPATRVAPIPCRANPLACPVAHGYTDPSSALPPMSSSLPFVGFAPAVLRLGSWHVG
jgi:hypothetical protein